MTKLTPMGDRVLVKLYPVEEVSPGGIHYSDSAKPPSHKATVIAKSHTPSKEGLAVNQGLKVGDTVLLNPTDRSIIGALFNE